MDFWRGEEYWEVKTNNREFEKAGYYFGSKNVSLLYAPPIDISVDDLPKFTTPDYDLLDRHQEKERKSFGRYAILNAEWFSGLTQTVDCKWYKMIHYPTSCLVFMYKDGLLTFSHHQLLDAASFYGWVKTTGNEEFEYYGPPYWQLKIFLDLSKGEFLPMYVPSHLLPNNYRKF